MDLVKAWSFVTDAMGWERFSKWAYRAIYWWLGGTATSFNLGYAPLSPAVQADSSWQEPYGIELYRQVAIEMGLERRRVERLLEVSCGLGGGLAYISRTFDVGYCVGLDLAFAAARAAGSRFGFGAVQADARKLPFGDGSFDAVLNVEASNNYYSNEFLAEVARVLAPGGIFGMADERYGAGTIEAVQSGLTSDMQRAGFEVVRFRIITANVIDAVNLDDARRERLISRSPWFVRSLVREWNGSAGSQKRASYDSGHTHYFSLVARRRAS
jgi:SAM-dependent methyltransferase